MKKDRNQIIAKILLIFSITSFGIPVCDGIKLFYDLYFKDKTITSDEITDRELEFIIEGIASLVASGALLGINDALTNENDNENENEIGKPKKLVK